MKYLCMVAEWCLIAGGLAWGVMGVMGMNLFSMIPGPDMVEMAVYILIGVSALYMTYKMITHHKECH